MEGESGTSDFNSGAVSSRPPLWAEGASQLEAPRQHCITGIRMEKTNIWSIFWKMLWSYEELELPNRLLSNTRLKAIIYFKLDFKFKLQKLPLPDLNSHRRAALKKWAAGWRLVGPRSPASDCWLDFLIFYSGWAAFSLHLIIFIGNLISVLQPDYVTVFVPQTF